MSMQKGMFCVVRGGASGYPRLSAQPFFSARFPLPTLELATVWPIVLVVLGNVVYQICSKSIPADVHPLAAVAVVYAIGTVVTIIMYHVINRGGNLLREFSGLKLGAVCPGRGRRRA